MVRVGLVEGLPDVSVRRTSGVATCRRLIQREKATAMLTCREALARRCFHTVAELTDVRARVLSYLSACH